MSATRTAGALGAAAGGGGDAEAAARWSASIAAGLERLRGLETAALRALSSKLAWPLVLLDTSDAATVVVEDVAQAPAMEECGPAMSVRAGATTTRTATFVGARR